MGGRRAAFPRSPAVSSPLRGLTSLFGMGRGAPPRLSRHSCRGPRTSREEGRAGPLWPRGGRMVAARQLAVPKAPDAPAHGGDPGPKPVGPLVPLGSTRRRAPTCGLSTSSSATALQGGLISGPASRLDALSAYPIRTRLPGGAPGGATGTP